LTVAERNAIYEHAAHRATAATEHIRWCMAHDPAEAAHAAHAAAGTLNIAAALTRNRVLRQAADSYDRAARACYGRLPRPTHEGHQLRAAARLLALTGSATDDTTQQLDRLIARLAVLVATIAELREAQRHAAQAKAARAAAQQLRAHHHQTGPASAWLSQSRTTRSTSAPNLGRRAVPDAIKVSAGQPAAAGRPRSRTSKPTSPRQAAGP
jgi:hypothetical protein